MAKIIERLEQKQCELAQPRDKAYLLNDGAGLNSINTGLIC